MKVLMLGWEFPPHISGGLGTACFGLTKGLDQLGVSVCFVLPHAVPIAASSHVQLLTPASLETSGGRSQRSFRNVAFKRVNVPLQAYGRPSGQGCEASSSTQNAGAAFSQCGQPAGCPGKTGKGFGGFRANYAGNMMAQLQQYKDLVLELAGEEDFDVVHAHDWMTYPAGLAVAAYTGKPLVIHVHSTEFDRSGQNINQQVYDIERAGIHGADSVICVSQFTRNLLLSRYAANPERLRVVYNAVGTTSGNGVGVPAAGGDRKTVLFLGRITMQKGPEYFLLAAKKVLEKQTNVRFVMSGDGDMFTRCVSMAAELGIGRYVTFTGFLRGAEVERVFRMADLYVMPSVSEPFGIAPLEALTHSVPVIVSRQSGVSEVLKNVLKADFWDIRDLADKMAAVLRHTVLRRCLSHNGRTEVQKFSWTDSARSCLDIYSALVGQRISA